MGRQVPDTLRICNCHSGRVLFDFVVVVVVVHMFSNWEITGMLGSILFFFVSWLLLRHQVFTMTPDQATIIRSMVGHSWTIPIEFNTRVTGWMLRCAVSFAEDRDPASITLRDTRTNEKIEDFQILTRWKQSEITYFLK